MGTLEYRKIRTRKNSVFGHFSRSEYHYDVKFISFEETDKESNRTVHHKYSTITPNHQQ